MLDSVLLTSFYKLSSPGGTGSYISTLSEQLNAAGVAVASIDSSHLTRRFPVIVNTGLGRLLKHADRDLGNNYLIWAAIRGLRTEVGKAIRSFHPQIVHAQDVYCGTAVADLCRQYHIPLVLTIHGPAEQEARMMKLGRNNGRLYEYIRHLEQIACTNATFVMGVDSAQTKSAEKAGALRTKTILNSVDADRFVVTDPPGTRMVVLVPRRLVPKNGVGTAIRAFKQVCARLPQAELVIAGDGPCGPELRTLAEHLQVNDRIRFLGNVPRDQMPALIAGCSCVLIPSVPVDGVVEASSIAALEAMSSGRPVIASNIGGLAEIIRNEQTGLLVPPGDPVALATAIGRILEGPTLAETMGRQARAEVDARFTAKAWGRSIMDVYRLSLEVAHAAVAF